MFYFIYHLDRRNVLHLPNDKAASVYDIFNWKYRRDGESTTHNDQFLSLHSEIHSILVFKAIVAVTNYI
ncbi:hypothetical protein N7501_001188 [Penicillium viridicatum]|nr:hypothetical protein N7501_001188 [Penicillium viridicatum]